MKIAMWSGPRNLSTALMFSFAARSDCMVWDEPFYAAYLRATGLKHPMRAEILAAGEQDADKVINECLTDCQKPVFFQKHMTQHMIPTIDRNWISKMTNVFLIRDPARVLASYAVKRENPTLDDIGFRQQAEIFDAVCQKQGSAPLVIDSFTLRANPRGVLQNLCDKIGIPFEESMLSWPKGGHPDSGVWSEHWYGAVNASTGFAGIEGPRPEVPEHLHNVLNAAQPYYEKLARYAEE